MAGACEGPDRLGEDDAEVSEVHTVHGALITTEQGDGHGFCCNLPDQCCDSHTARLAAVEAFYAWRTGDAELKQSAARSFNWVTYWQGLPGGAHAPFSDQWWFTDEFTDGPRRMMDAFQAFPEWAPADESHLLGSSSVVTRIHYGDGSVTYSTFDEASDDVLRLDFVPTTISADGRPLTRAKADDVTDAYTFDEATKVLRIHHQHARNVDIEGQGTGRPIQYVRFDNPHLAANTLLVGQYPAGLVDWGADREDAQWQIHAPAGKFGTFCLSLASPAIIHARFALPLPTVFAGVDAYNAGPHTAVVHLRSPQQRELAFTLQPGELKRIRTGWRDPSTSVDWAFENGEGLLFDNLALRP